MGVINCQSMNYTYYDREAGFYLASHLLPQKTLLQKPHYMAQRIK